MTDAFVCDRGRIDMSRVINYVKEIAEKYQNIGFEGIVVLDIEGRTQYEKRWIQDYPRDIYSNTKSFTGAAVGMAIYQNKILLDTAVTELFGLEKCTPMWNKMRLRDLLTMRSGFSREHLMYFDRRRGIGSENYLDYLFAQEVTFEPGSHYIYSTGDTILAGCMVERAVGMSLHAYLYENLFLPLNIDYPIWESDLSGHTCGGSGLQLKLVDMAKLGCVYLNDGYLNNVRFFNSSWTNLSFIEYVPLNEKKYPESYGFFWRICNNGQFYKATGSFGQDTLIIPNEKCVLGYQCREGTDTNLIRDILQKELFEKLI